MTKLIYLAGPIAGLSYDGATNWRMDAAEALDQCHPWAGGTHEHVKTLSPLRAKDYLKDVQQLSNKDVPIYAQMSPLSTPRGIMTRDHNDATRCDVMFVNLFGAEKISMGTMMELAWAYDRHIPVVCWIETQGNIHDHPMVNECIDFRASTFDECVALVKTILG